MLTENEIGEIVSRHARGEGKVKIAKAMGISTRTVLRYLRMPPEQLAQHRIEQRMEKSCKLDQYRTIVQEEFALVGGNCVNLQELLKQKHGLSINLRTLEWYCQTKLPCRQALNLAKSRSAKHNKRIETTPGQELQVDFGEADVPVDGKLTRIHFFVGVLGYSRRFHATFFPCENSETWLCGLEKAFLYFGGVARQVICDNAKALVYQPGRRGLPVIYNETFKCLCHYWGTTPVACPPSTPEHKGKVERVVSYIKGSFLKDFREFKSLEDIQIKFELWESEVAAKRKMETADQIPIPFTPENRFWLDSQQMRPVDKEPISLYRIERRKVDASGFVCIDNRHYEIGQDHRNQIVDVLIGRSQIAVSLKGKTLKRLDKDADSRQPITRPALVEEHAAKASALPPSSLDRDLTVYEKVAPWTRATA